MSSGEAATEPVRVSLIICTRNRLAALQQMLPRYLAAARACEFRTEVVVVDNASTDGTSTFLAGIADPYLEVVTARLAGLSRARTVGCLSAKGEVIVFTDDDVDIHPSWVTDMVTAIFSGDADAVSARIALDPAYDDLALSAYFRRRLAETVGLQTDDPPLVGAGMAFRRSLLRDALFDPDLGAGVAGTSFGEDVLFEWMIKAAGARLAWSEGPPAIHRPSRDRLDRGAWLAMARAHGRTDAYLSHHWLGAKVAMLPVRLLRNVLRLRLYQLRHGRGAVTEQEMDLVAAAAMSAQLLVERRTQAKYRPRG